MLKGLLKHRGLIYELAVRDIKLRYRKPYLGFFWMLIIPFATAIVYKILFSDFMQVTSGSYPFFIYLLTALLPWSYFCSSVQAACRSILDNRNIINQISFPKYILPVSTVLANLINFLPTILVLLGFLFAFRIKVDASVLFLPAVILIQTCMIIGLSLLVSCLQVVYRDVEYITQLALMVLFFMTPGVYTLEELVSKASPLFTKIYMLNPLVGILDLYRITFIGDYLKNMPKEANLLNTLFIPLLSSFVLLLIGIFVFSKYEKKFFDHINV
jgi:ABC-type polysaccharide/polyol phosphate export permease